MEVSGRPLFDNAADAQLFLSRPEAKRLEENCQLGVNTLITGERGSGKTSLIRQVAYRLRELGRGAVVLDASGAEGPAELIGLIEGELVRAGEINADPSSRHRDAMNAAAGETGQLISAIRRLRTEAPRGPLRTVLFIDSPPAANAVTSLFGRMRDELWQLPYTWVVTAPSSRRAELLKPPADAFFEDVIELGRLTQVEQADLISLRLGKEESVPWLLTSENETNPRQLLEAVREAIRSQRSPEELLRAQAERERSVAALGRTASMVYAELQSSGPVSASDEGLQRTLGISRQRLAQVLAALEKAGLVRSAERPGPSGRPRKTFEPTPVRPS